MGSFRRATGMLICAGLMLVHVPPSAYCSEVKSPPVKAQVPVSDEVKTTAEANAGFAFDLYSKLHVQEGNLAFSPYSVSTALAMTYVGAGGETAAQMAKTLHFEGDGHQLAKTFSELNQVVQAAKKGKKGRLNVANALWGQTGEAFLPAFLATTKEAYGAGLMQVDFHQQSEDARVKINKWVAEQTQQKIKELLQHGDIDASTELVLTNAIYFRADWMTRFDPKRTQPADFRLAPGKSVKVPMMHLKGTFRTAAIGEELNLIEIPYEGGDFSMIILLPSKDDGLSAMEKSLTAEKLKNWQSKLETSDVNLSMPRFKLDSRQSLAKVLHELGMADAFSAGQADFSGMNGRKHDLCISDVIHQATVEVDEHGTVATAATAVVSMRAGPPTRIPTFTVDHPFVMLIQEQQTGSVLFVGRVADPSK